jgi:DNA-binding MarR family transcriptional regulator
MSRRARPRRARSSRSFDPEEFESEKRASVGQLLFKCARLYNEHAIARVRERFGLDRLRMAHTALFPHLELSGIRLTELARRLGVSKPAAAELVDELESMGMLTRMPDPEDRRAKRIVFTPRGRKGLLEGLTILAELECELSDVVGERHMGQLRVALGALLPALEDLERR